VVLPCGHPGTCPPRRLPGDLAVVAVDHGLLNDQSTERESSTVQKTSVFEGPPSVYRRAPDRLGGSVFELDKGVRSDVVMGR
jgi:hypothetical protein